MSPQYEFLQMRGGGGQRLFGTFLKISLFWYGYFSLTRNIFFQQVFWLLFSLSFHPILLSKLNYWFDFLSVCCLCFITIFWFKITWYIYLFVFFSYIYLFHKLFGKGHLLVWLPLAPPLPSLQECDAECHSSVGASFQFCTSCPLLACLQPLFNLVLPLLQNLF